MYEIYEYNIWVETKEKMLVYQEEKYHVSKRRHISTTLAATRTAGDDAHKLVPESLLLLAAVHVAILALTDTLVSVVGRNRCCPAVGLLAQQILLCCSGGPRGALFVLQLRVAVDQSRGLLDSLVLKLLALGLFAAVRVGVTGGVAVCGMVMVLGMVKRV